MYSAMYIVNEQYSIIDWYIQIINLGDTFEREDFKLLTYAVKDSLCFILFAIHALAQEMNGLPKFFVNMFD